MTRTLGLIVLASLAGMIACQPRAGSTPEPQSSAAMKPASRAALDHAAAGVAARVGTDPGRLGRGTPLEPRPGHELAAFAEGCFWGSENTFRHVQGVVATAVGYTGGHTDNPTYEAVCSHTTGHAETVLVEFDPRVISYEKLLSVFWETHDPTTRNRQGPDVGDQYRSAVFTFSDAQATVARASLAREQKHLGLPITTEITRIGRFYAAEDYHQQYDEKSGTESCPLPLRSGRLDL